MKLKHLALVIAAALLAACFMPVGVAAEEPASEKYVLASEEITELLFEKYNESFCTDSFNEGTAPSADDIYYYLLFIGELWEGGDLSGYGDGEDHYVIPYDVFEKTAKKHFAVVGDLKDLTSDDGNIEYYLGFGGFDSTMYPLMCVNEVGTDNYYVLGVRTYAAYGDLDGLDIRPHYDYYPSMYEDREVRSYFNSCKTLCFKKVGDNFLINGLVDNDFYVYDHDGNLYKDPATEGMSVYYSLTVVLENAKVDFKDGVSDFDRTPCRWVKNDVSTVKFTVEKSGELAEITYRDDNGEQKLTPDASGTYSFTPGPNAVLTVKAADASTAPETTAPETTAPETTAPETTAPETTAPETTDPETNAPETNGGEGTSDAATDADGSGEAEKSGCSSSLGGASVIFAASLAAAVITKKKR